jgi:TolB-like protein
VSSIIKGYNYDIFISYRQKDNKGDRWVSEFVETLKTELESTFKEEISVYFDINPHDGLLETHDVDESLKEKLKCLIFIPIISRTYCDPKSFAWEHEFKAFIELASQDQFGLKVRLPNGNVASRVLPVRIHDLNISDAKFCESVLGGILRGIEFIYKEPGVNKPLTNDDDEKKNLNSTKYRIQINKTAIAINEIIAGLRKEPLESTTERKEALLIEDKPFIKEKSIIVLPFENISPDPDQEYFSDGLTEEIITDLSHIHGLLVISRSSAMTFKGTKSTIKEITDKVNVRYVLEGSVRKAGNNLRITAQLIDGINDSHIWAENYSGTLNDIFDIQEKVALSIVNSLRLKLTTQESQSFVLQPIQDLRAYDYYLRAKQDFWAWDIKALRRAEQNLKNGLDITGENELIYAGLGFINFQIFNYGLAPDYSLLEKVREYANKIFKINPGSTLGVRLLGLAAGFTEPLQKASMYFRKVLEVDPNDSESLFFYFLCLIYSGRNDEAKAISNRLLKIDPLPWLNHLAGILISIMEGDYSNTLSQCKKIYLKEPGNPYIKFMYAYSLAYVKDYDKAFIILDEVATEGKDFYLGSMSNFVKYCFQGDKEKALISVSQELKKKSENDFELAFQMAECYALINEKKSALDCMENAINRGVINYPFWAEKNPFLENLRVEDRFKKLMERVKYEWENFEV